MQLDVEESTPASDMTYSLANMYKRRILILVLPATMRTLNSFVDHSLIYAFLSTKKRHAR